MSAVSIPLLTASDYLEIERKADFRSEFHDGVMYAMAGGTPRHSRVSANCMTSLGQRLRGKKCQPYNSDMRIFIKATGLYTYPDLSVVCGPREFEEKTTDCLVNPSVIIEVLSPSTSDYDRGKKFWNYRHIPSLTDYILVGTDEVLIEHYTRQPTGQWLLTSFEELSANLPIQSLGLEIPVEEIYADLD